MEGQRKMNKTEKKKIARFKWKLGVCITAFTAAVSIFIILLQIEKNALAQYEKGLVYIAAETIPEGAVVTEENCEKYFELVETDKILIPASALTDYNQLLGLVAKYDVEKGTLLSSGMFQPLNEVLRDMKEPVIAGLKADDLFQVAGGVLRAGDRIHIFNINAEGKAELCWEEVYVESVFDQAGKEISNGDKTASAQRINVYMEKDDVEVFYSKLFGGSLRVVKAY